MPQIPFTRKLYSLVDLADQDFTNTHYSKESRSVVFLDKMIRCLGSVALGGGQRETGVRGLGRDEGEAG